MINLFSSCLVCLKLKKIKSLPLYHCNICNIIFDNIDDLDYHLKLKCSIININCNNIYKFDNNKLGEHIYDKENGGNIYIIQTDISYKNYYKIGITTNLQNRISTYRSGCVIEPRLHCFFPIKNIKIIDKQLKIDLIKYNIKREIYKIDNLNEVVNIIKNLQKSNNSNELEVLPELKNCDIILCNKCNQIYYKFDEHKCI